MKKIFTTCIVLFVFTVCSAFAADTTKDQTRTKDQKKDGSCMDLIDTAPDNGNPTDILIIAKQSKNGSGDQDRDRLRDGSCQDNVDVHDAEYILAADQDRDREKDRKKDGSCTT